jgi:hypothetical protein
VPSVYGTYVEHRSCTSMAAANISTLNYSLSSCLAMFPVHVV